MTTQEQALARARLKAAEQSQPRFQWRQFGRYIAVALVVLVSLGPLYWTVATSVKNGLELNDSPPTIVPHSFSLQNYITDLTQTPTFIHGLINSTIISACTTILALIFGSLAAYAIARINFKGKSLVLAIILSVQMFPFIAMVGPLFVIFTGPLYIYNTYLALIIPDLVLTLPLSVWFLTSFFRDLPPDLEEAARVDGASRLRALWEVIIPLTAPGVFTVAILSFIAVWNDFLFGLTLTSDSNAQPVTVAIANFNGEHTIPWGEIAAAGVVVMLPLVIVVLFLQRRIVSGLTAGAVKG
jgi:ABC-type glycerol-3-phosphate transport system permease component